MVVWLTAADICLLGWDPGASSPQGCSTRLTLELCCSRLVPPSPSASVSSCENQASLGTTAGLSKMVMTPGFFRPWSLCPRGPLPAGASVLTVPSPLPPCPPPQRSVLGSASQVMFELLGCIAPSSDHPPPAGEFPVCPEQQLGLSSGHGTPTAPRSGPSDLLPLNQEGPPSPSEPHPWCFPLLTAASALDSQAGRFFPSSGLGSDGTFR